MVLLLLTMLTMVARNDSSHFQLNLSGSNRRGCATIISSCSSIVLIFQQKRSHFLDCWLIYNIQWAFDSEFMRIHSKFWRFNESLRKTHVFSRYDEYLPPMSKCYSVDLHIWFTHDDSKRQIKHFHFIHKLMCRM